MLFLVRIVGLELINVALRRAVARNLPPAGCIYIGSSPSNNKKTATSNEVAVFLVRIAGLEPVRSLIGT